MNPTFCSGRSDLPVERQIIIKYGSVFYLSALVHILHHPAPGAIQHSGSLIAKNLKFQCVCEIFLENPHQRISDT